MSEKIVQEKDDELIITVKTVATTKARMMKGDYRGFIWTLRADPANTGNIYIGKSAESCTYLMDADDVQVTRCDLDKLWWYSDNGTEKMHIWGDREK